MKDLIRRRVRAVQRSGEFPLLLPHHLLSNDQVSSVDGRVRTLTAGVSKALGLCDGARTLGQVARESGVAKSELIKAHDEGFIVIWRSAVTQSAPTTGHAPHSIIVSPHLDDAALSCGGRMLGDDAVLVLNVFSRGAWWRFENGNGDAARVESCRRAEEALVLRLCGAATMDLMLSEALLRGHAMAEIFTATPDERDAEVCATIGEATARLAREHRLAHWFLPLGIGGHIDHRIVRDAVMAALEREGVAPTHLHFYEDLPYAAKLGAEADFSDHLPGRRLRAELLEIDELIDWKLEMLRAYWSQFGWSEIEGLRRYAKAVGGGEAMEVTWTAA